MGRLISLSAQTRDCKRGTDDDEMILLCTHLDNSKHALLFIGHRLDLCLLKLHYSLHDNNFSICMCRKIFFWAQNVSSTLRNWDTHVIPYISLLKIVAPELLYYQKNNPIWLWFSFISQVSNLKPVTCTGWTRGALVTVALVAAVTIFGALWVEWKA